MRTERGSRREKRETEEKLRREKRRERRERREKRKGNKERMYAQGLLLEMTYKSRSSAWQMDNRPIVVKIPARVRSDKMDARFF